jgi:hypothetical protein
MQVCVLAVGTSVPSWPVETVDRKKTVKPSFSPTSAVFLPRLLFYHEDGGNMFLLTTRRYSPEERTLIVIAVKISNPRNEIILLTLTKCKCGGPHRNQSPFVTYTVLHRKLNMNHINY